MVPGRFGGSRRGAEPEDVKPLPGSWSPELKPEDVTRLMALYRAQKPPPIHMLSSTAPERMPALSLCGMNMTTVRIWALNSKLEWVRESPSVSNTYLTVTCPRCNKTIRALQNNRRPL